MPNIPSVPSAASATKDHDGGQNNFNCPMTSAMTSVAPIWSARVRLGRPPSRTQTVLTALTQTPPFVLANGGHAAPWIWVVCRGNRPVGRDNQCWSGFGQRVLDWAVLQRAYLTHL